MAYSFDQPIDRRQTESIKWRHYDQDVLPMWVADMDFRSPDPVIQALHERVEHGVFGYPDESTELRQVLVKRLAERYQWQVKLEDILLMPGVVTGFNQACHALGRSGDDVLIQTPVYGPFLKAPEYAGLNRVDSNLVRREGGQYGIDFEEFERTITQRTRLFILCNPHNPVGRVFTREELTRMGEICLRHSVTICSDEIHCDLVFNGHTHLPIASLSPDLARQSITLMAPSKTYNIAGLDCSFAVIQDVDLRKQFIKAGKGLVKGVNLFGITAALAAYKDGQGWLDELLVYLQGNRDVLVDFVKNNLPGVTMGIPEGTYLAWLDCRNLELDQDPGEFFLTKARVAVNEGKGFGKGGEGFVRLNFGCTRSMLLEALEKMAFALKNR
jgi:cystathionine beta-lyase